MKRRGKKKKKKKKKKKNLECRMLRIEETVLMTKEKKKETLLSSTEIRGKLKKLELPNKNVKNPLSNFVLWCSCSLNALHYLIFPFHLDGGRSNIALPSFCLDVQNRVCSLLLRFVSTARCFFLGKDSSFHLEDAFVSSLF